MTRYDRPGTLFYLDPPYWGNEQDYGHGLFGRDEFAEMVEGLKGIQGRFILSINDRPETRALFEGFEMRTDEVPIASAGSAIKRWRRN